MPAGTHSTGRGPEHEVSHAWQPLKPYPRQHLQPMRGGIEERAKDVRSGEFEFSPQGMLRPALPFVDRRQRQQGGAIGKIGTGNDIPAVEDDPPPGGRKQYLVLIGG